MSPEARLDALRGCLAGAPAWPEVLTRLACWTDDDALEVAVREVELAVDRWPAFTRGLSRLVVGQLLAGRMRRYLKLVGALDLKLLGQDRDHPTLLKRMIAEGGLRELYALTTRYDRGDELADLLARHIVGLRRLALGGSAVGTAGVRALAGCEALAGLTELSLPNNLIIDADAELLLAAPQLGGLRSLNLYGNRLSDSMIEKIRAAPQWAGATIVHHGQRSV